MQPPSQNPSGRFGSSKPKIGVRGNTFGLNSGIEGPAANTNLNLWQIAGLAPVRKPVFQNMVRPAKAAKKEEEKVKGGISGMLADSRFIKKEKYAKTFIKNRDELIKLGVSPRKVRTWKQRLAVGKELAGVSPDEKLPDFISKKAIRKREYERRRDIRGLHTEISSALRNDNRTSSMEAGKKERDIYRKMLGK